MVKTYFYTSTEETKLPDEFLVSKNVKYIHVLHCRCVYNEGLAGDIELHASFIQRHDYRDSASFIQRHDYRDSFVCYTNTILTKYKKYEVVRPKPTFKVWFTNMNGEKVDVQNFNLELMLEYWFLRNLESKIPNPK